MLQKDLHTVSVVPGTILFDCKHQRSLIHLKGIILLGSTILEPIFRKLSDNAYCCMLGLKGECCMFYLLQTKR